MEAKAVLLLLVAVVALSSGCTQVCDVIPIPGFCSGGTTEYTDDVIVIKSLEALPNTVSPGQQMKIRAYVENIGNEKVDDIAVVLYDYCKGLFTADPECPNGEAYKNSKGCTISLLPKQSKSVSWVLNSNNDIKLKTSCDLKIYANYFYQTDSVTSITLMNYAEYQKQIDDGTFSEISSYITEGYGPIKPYLIVEDKQPIPVDASNPAKATLSFHLENKGNGFVSPDNSKINGIKYKWGNNDTCDPMNGETTICMTAKKIGGFDIVKKMKECIDEYFKVDKNQNFKVDRNQNNDKYFEFIKKKTPPIVCTIDLNKINNLPKQSTMHITTAIKYSYEFRRDVKVTVEPKI